MTEDRRDAGRRGEDLAAQYLERNGYRVVQRNFRCRLGEMDLVAEGPEGLLFVEVRTKRRPCLFQPEESITRAKAHRLVRLAEHYLESTGQSERQWRVDVVAVELEARGEVARLEWFKDATCGLVAS